MNKRIVAAKRTAARVSPKPKPIIWDDPDAWFEHQTSPLLIRIALLETALAKATEVVPHAGSVVALSPDGRWCVIDSTGQVHPLFTGTVDDGAKSP